LLPEKEEHPKVLNVQQEVVKAKKITSGRLLRQLDSDEKM